MLDYVQHVEMGPIENYHKSGGVWHHKLRNFQENGTKVSNFQGLNFCNLDVNFSYCRIIHEYVHTYIHIYIYIAFFPNTIDSSHF
jgi:hypothetical protein